MAEAEYAVAIFMYMRLQGYPPDKITILTTYNGQKHLIRDVLNKRCGSNPYFGNPEKVGWHQLEKVVLKYDLYPGDYGGSLPRIPE